MQKKKKGRSYHYEDVRPDNQYDPQHVQALLRLDKMGLTDGVCNFTPFIKLQKLNISQNKIVNLLGLYSP